jgi:hypothetical protein
MGPDPSVQKNLGDPSEFLGGHGPEAANRRTSTGLGRIREERGEKTSFIASGAEIDVLNRIFGCLRHPRSP